MLCCGFPQSLKQILYLPEELVYRVVSVLFIYLFTLFRTTELVDIIRQVQNEEPFEDSLPGIDEGHSVLDVQPILEERQPFFQVSQFDNPVIIK
jgi:hypothetical protein